MPKLTREKIHELDMTWMKWLKTASKYKGSTDKGLLEEYTTDEEAWQLTMANLAQVSVDNWVFLRGQLSEKEIREARDRYLNKYVFVAGTFGAQPFVDALLSVERAQIKCRIDNAPRPVCEGCVEKERIIATLREAARGDASMDPIEERVSALRSLYHRYYIVDCASGTTRTDLRKGLEQLLQQEISPDESLSSQSEAWKRFVKAVMHCEDTGYRPFRCRRRAMPTTTE